MGLSLEPPLAWNCGICSRSLRLVMDQLYTQAYTCTAPPSHEEKGLVTTEQVLGCVKSAVLILDMPLNEIVPHRPSICINQWNRPYIVQPCLLNQDCWLSPANEITQQSPHPFPCERLGSGSRDEPFVVAIFSNLQSALLHSQPNVWVPATDAVFVLSDNIFVNPTKYWEWTYKWLGSHKLTCLQDINARIFAHCYGSVLYNLL